MTLAPPSIRGRAPERQSPSAPGRALVKRSTTRRRAGKPWRTPFRAVVLPLCTPPNGVCRRPRSVWPPGTHAPGGGHVEYGTFRFRRRQRFVGASGDQQSGAVRPDGPAEYRDREPHADVHFGTPRPTVAQAFHTRKDAGNFAVPSGRVPE